MNSKYPGGSGDLTWAFAVNIANILNVMGFCSVRICMYVYYVYMYVYKCVYVYLCICACAYMYMNVF